MVRGSPHHVPGQVKEETLSGRSRGIGKKTRRKELKERVVLNSVFLVTLRFLLCCETDGFSLFCLSLLLSEQNILHLYIQLPLSNMNVIAYPIGQCKMYHSNAEIGPV